MAVRPGEGAITNCLFHADLSPLICPLRDIFPLMGKLLFILALEFTTRHPELDSGSGYFYGEIPNQVWNDTFFPLMGKLQIVQRVTRLRSLRALLHCLLILGPAS